MAGSETQLIMPLTQAEPGAMRQAMQAAAHAGADAVELRLDYLAEPAAALGPLLDRPPCPVLLTCRSAQEGGGCDRPGRQRAALLAQGARIGCRWVDFELACLDAAGELLKEVAPPGAADPSDKRPQLIVSSHDFQRRPADLADTLAKMEAGPGHVNKVAFAAAGPEDAWAAFDVLRESRKPALALAMGEHGLASRILARKFGAFGTFAALDAGSQSAPGQPTLHALRHLYRWDSINPGTKVFGVVGCPVGHSMSPAIHNAAFAADGVDAVYVPLRVEAGPDNFNRFIDAVVDRPWSDLAGLSVTIPHKRNALARVGAGNVDDLAAAIGAINTIVLPGETGRPMRGYNTDYAAAIDALVEGIGCNGADLAGRTVAVLGAGGAARAIVAALAHHGAHTTIYNRTVSRGRQLAGEFDAIGPGSVKAKGLDELGGLSAGIIINCTPLGMHPHPEGRPLPEEMDLPCGTVVFDTIYNPIETRLLRRSADAGCRTVSGIEMFINQAAAQYEMWTSRSAPRQVMREVVLECLTRR